MVGAAAGTRVMIAAGEPAVVVLFGEKRRGAGVALVAMSGLNIGSAVSVVVQDAIKAQGRTRLINWFTLGDFVLGVGFLITLIGPFGFVGASLYISLTSMGCAVIMLILAQRVMTVPFRKVLRVQATPLPATLTRLTARRRPQPPATAPPPSSPRARPRRRQQRIGEPRARQRPAGGRRNRKAQGPDGRRRRRPAPSARPAAICAAGHAAPVVIHCPVACSVNNAVNATERSILKLL